LQKRWILRSILFLKNLPFLANSDDSLHKGWNLNYLVEIKLIPTIGRWSFVWWTILENHPYWQDSPILAKLGWNSRIPTHHQESSFLKKCPLGMIR
jgi:hypothetical protein